MLVDPQFFNKSLLQLSICIPTFNRGLYLHQTIASIVRQPAFYEGNLVEIVVTDNFSQDSTHDVCNKFLQLYPGKFIYHRELNPIHAAFNCRNALNLASGRFLKINNDTLIHEANSLDYILNALYDSCNSVSSNIKVTPFFSIGILSIVSSSPVLCSSMSEFLRLTNGLSTYIGAFGVWREEFHHIQDLLPDIAWENRFGHVDILFRLFELGYSFSVYNEKIGCINKPVNHGGYDMGEVMIGEYLRLCRRSFSIGLIDKNSFFREVRRTILVTLSWYNNQIIYPDLYSYQFVKLFDRIRDVCVGNYVLLLQSYLHQRLDYLLKFVRKFLKSFLLKLLP